MVFQRPVSAASLGRRERSFRPAVAPGAAAEAAGSGGRSTATGGPDPRGQPFAARVLSGGEQQRLALVRAWTLQPQVLFLDEPTAHLDPTATRAVETLLEQFHTAGTKLIMTTHDLGQARRLADEVIFLHRGRLLEHSPADAFFAQPRSAEAAAFLDGNLLW